MRAVIPLLVLLFSMCGAQTQSTQTEVQTESQSTGAAAAAVVTTTLDVATELARLRDTVDELGTTVVELRVTLTFTQNELQNTKSLLYTVEDENNAQETKLAVMKTEIENLKMENTAQETELAVMKERLVASETKVDALERVNAAQEAELTAVKTEVMNLIKANAAQETEMVKLKMETAAQETRLSASETEVENLKMETAVQPKVAFSAGLTDSGNIESGNTDLNLVFTKIITNVGQAYSSTTGFFTAPVRGVYYFRFTVMDHLTSRFMFIRMYKNGEQIMQLVEYDADGQATYLSSGATLQLEEGDVVNMRLPTGGYRLYDDVNNLSTFSGFLLFPL
ncbi:heavy metal-binding protein HIP-like [Sardina pilchardus]|uniref:heavy metal-binding protein HIP-like n=1 Tax=Sardina pilchardus TaxID=27697 RepID=UPI002E1483D6